MSAQGIIHREKTLLSFSSHLHRGPRNLSDVHTELITHVPLSSKNKPVKVPSHTFYSVQTYTENSYTLQLSSTVRLGQPTLSHTHKRAGLNISHTHTSTIKCAVHSAHHVKPSALVRHDCSVEREGT